MSEKPKRRALTAREKLMREKYTRLVKWNPKHNAYGVFLVVGVQSFGISNGCVDRRSAMWLQDMLAAALAKIEL